MADNYAFEREDGTTIEAPAGHENKPVNERPKSTNVDVNLNCDPGILLVEDCQSYEGVKAKEFSKRTAANICTLYKQLFDLKKAQDAQHGPDGEILEYTKSRYLMDMPDAIQVLPREKPCPEEKAKTKWEKFREERGMAPRKKRSRLVFDPLTNDWVPRWGADSVKKIADKHQWLMPTKEKHIEAGMDPFTFAKAEKRAKQEKQNLAEVKNKVNAIKPGAMKDNDIKILAAKDSNKNGNGLKRKSDEERTQVRKREHKSLMKSLKLAQMSTASMGKFDRKAGKNEPDAPTSQKIAKKKSTRGLGELDHNKGKEKERNMKIFNMLQKKTEIKTAGVAKPRVNAHIDAEKVARKAQKKEETARRKAQRL